MKWVKKGRICGSDSFDLPWYKKNTMVPVPYLRKDGLLRIYLTMCDEENAGRMGYVDVNPDNPGEIVKVSKTPALDVGCAGAFDDSGVLPSSLLIQGDKLYMYYSAYQKLGKVPYAILSGLAVSTDGGDSFIRTSQVPVLERTDAEMFLRSAIFCMQEGDTYKIWYSSGSGWTHNKIKDVPVYDIKYLESRDLQKWDCAPRPSISLQDDEFGLTIPSVWKDGGLYKMIYSIRSLSKGYRLGYAESADGVGFTRMDDQIGIDVSADGWDSEMICFGNRFQYKDKTYLFYCGNHYGQGGFGYAELTA